MPIISSSYCPSGFLRLLAAVLFPVTLQAAQLSLSWTDNSSNEHGFKIERAADGAGFTQIATVGPNVTSYSDSGLKLATTYWYRVRAYNGAGNSSYSNAVSATTAAVLSSKAVFPVETSITLAADGSFQSKSLAAGQTGRFSVTFDATPSAQGIDGVIGLSSGPAAAFADLAAIVRFNASGNIDARNGSSYAASSPIVYTAGVTYTFRMQVDLSNRTYSVYVTAPGGAEQAVGSDFAFRTEQGAVTSLDSWSARLGTEIADASVSISGFGLPAGNSSARLINLSTRGMVNGTEPLITGFAVQGTGTQRVLIRAIGRTLEDFGISKPVAAPAIAVVRNSTGATLAETNGGWENGPNTGELLQAMTETGAFLLETGRGDAAMVIDLEPGLYSAVVRDAAGVGGTCLVETYMVNANDAGKLINLSTRGYAASGGDVMIAGLVISGSESKRVLIRGAGPSLGQLGVVDAMVDPQLAVFARSGGDPILVNDDWGDDGAAPLVSATASMVSAFAFAAGSADAALVVDLSPGIYSVHLSPASGIPGTGLIEVYEVQ